MELEPEIERVKAELSILPEGKLVCCHSGNGCKWFVSDGRSKKYLPKSEVELAKKLAYKRYLQEYLDELLLEYKASLHYSKICLKIKPASELLSDVPELRRLTNEYFTPLSIELNM